MMGFIYTARSSASSDGPIITGTLAGKGMLWVAFVTAGPLMVVYDMGALSVWGHKSQCQDAESQGRIQTKKEIIQ
jgi:hypothetical protein